MSPLESNPLFGQLPLELSESIRRDNPWWSGRAAPALPPFRRWPFQRRRHLLGKGLAPATVLRGPRRVGKTILLRQVMDSLLTTGCEANRILYVAFDELPTFERISEPILAISRWYEDEILKSSFNEADRRGAPAFLFLDEVQNLESWAPQVKHLVDSHRVRVLLTGSSSLRIEAGRDSLAGRVTTMDLGPLLLREIAGMRLDYDSIPIWADNGLDRLTRSDFWQEAVREADREKGPRGQSFELFSERGAFPLAHERADVSWAEIADHLNETVIKRAIQHDLRMGERGRKRDEKLLEEVFRLCCRYAGQTPGQRVFVPEINQALGGNIGWNRILNYLRFLDGTLLIRLVAPMEARLSKKGARTPKVCLCDHALRASWLQEEVPLDPDGLAKNPHLTDIAGHLAESILGYYFASIPNLDVAHVPARGAAPEVDFVLTVGAQRIPIEVKYCGRIDPHGDTHGLRAFLEKTTYNAPLALLVTLNDGVAVNDPRIIPISLSSLLWLR
jgi:hypothetical protein